MEGSSKKDESCPPQLIDLNREWLIAGEQRRRRSHGFTEEKSLELRLAPPGDDDGDDDDRHGSSSLLSLGYFPNSYRKSPIGDWWSHKLCSSENPNGNGATLSSSSSPWSPPVAMAKESCNNKVAEEEKKKAFSPAAPAAITAVPNSSQKRTAPAPVVGWPPVRSFRKNLTSSSSSKPSPQSRDEEEVVPNKIENGKQVKNNNNNSSSCKGMFVKINMDGVPIGRKVDLKAYDSYEKLSSAVDQLFRGLLAAQEDTFVDGVKRKGGEEKAITGLLDGSGEYTLVYEDNEGDRMLVGDVPWHMFVSTVKRLRVLKSSELSALRVGGKQEKRSTNAAKV